MPTHEQEYRTLYFAVHPDFFQEYHLLLSHSHKFWNKNSDIIKCDSDINDCGKTSNLHVIEKGCGASTLSTIYQIAICAQKRATCDQNVFVNVFWW